jgi:uncharacterized membrane protein YphA (DoxX/SURF4 family)
MPKHGGGRFSLGPRAPGVYDDRMSLPFSGFLLAVFGVSLILITLSLRMLPRNGDTYSTGARFFLIALRVAIGWHCFVEGMEKITSPTWTSETYLRESMGPLADVYHSVAGDRLVAKATLGPGDSFPTELEREWRQYFDAFAAYYNLDQDQLKRAEAIYETRKAETVKFLKSKTEVTKIAPYPPDLKLDMTMADRLKEHDRLAERVRAVEANFPSTDKDVLAEWKTAKADLAKWRGAIKKDLDAQTDKLKKIDESFRTAVKKNIAGLTNKWRSAPDTKESAKLKKELDAETAKLWEPLTDVLNSDQRERGPLPEPIAVPMKQWRELEISDAVVKGGLAALGGCLLLGFLSRASSMLLALLVLSFYLAMPPLPGWPESPRLEGHYLLINKTLIEVIALLALAFIPTGRWAGLDGLLCCCFGGKNKAAENKPPTP